MLLNRERHMANPVRTCGVWKERSSVDLILPIIFSAECYMKIILFQEPITLGNVRDYSCTMSSSIYKQGDEEEVCMVQFQSLGAKQIFSIALYDSMFVHPIC